MDICEQLLGGAGLGLFMGFVALLLVANPAQRRRRALIGGGLGGFASVFVGPWAVPAGVGVGAILAWTRWIGPLGDLFTALLAGLASGAFKGARSNRRTSRRRGGWFGGGGRSGGGGASGSW
ncbi:MAG: hypothetical protein QM581_15510 [Pseudomonas sp.]